MFFSETYMYAKYALGLYAEFLKAELEPLVTDVLV